MSKITDPLLRRLLHLLGTWVGGDLGPFTIYTTRRRKGVWYPRAPPKDPPTVAQLRQRNRFALAMQRWRLLAAPEKTAWEALANTLGLCATGHNLYIHLALSFDDAAWQTAVRKTGTTLTPPELIPK